MNPRRFSNSPSSLSRLARLVLVIALAGAAVVSLRSRAQARDLTSQEMIQLQEIASDPSRYEETIVLVRSLLASDIDAGYTPTFRQMLLTALIRGQKPAKEIVAAAETLDANYIKDPRTRMTVLGQVAEVLLDRGEEPAIALDFAQRAHDASPPGAEYEVPRALTGAILGRAQLANGQTDAAITSLTAALVAPDSAIVLYHLGRAYEKKGSNPQAIDSYVRSLGVFPPTDTTAAAPLRAVYKKEHKNLKGMDERVKTARRASRQNIALDAHYYGFPAPMWQLPDFAGKSIGHQDFAGKIVVVDFWGSWCGPCRIELPIIQKTYERYKNRVSFMTINWERGIPRDRHLREAKDFVEANQFTFPVVLDYDSQATKAFDVQAFPTVFVIDRKGQIRYRNVGFDRNVEYVLAAQIEAMLEESEAK